IIMWLGDLPPAGIYLALWGATYVENIFPPSPSDAIMLFIATLIGVGTIGFLPAIGVATAGSVMGFLTAFMIGRRYGRRLVETRKLPFVNEGSLTKVDRWFEKYGYWVIVGNRFLAGTRGVISFFAGMSQLDFRTTTILCTASALVWNGLIIWFGSVLGRNWRLGERIIMQYGMVVTIVLATVAVIFIIRALLRRRKAS
ncbi:MAG: DedA family protein, partial [Bacteroidota bacterium]